MTASRGTSPGGDPLAEAVELTRRLKLPHIRRHLLELVPTARAQRWDHTALVRVLARRENLWVGRGIALFTIEDLGALVRRHRADDSITRALARLIYTDRRHRAAVRVTGRSRRVLSALPDAADERRSLAVSSNLHPSGFDGIMPKTLATATVDRLLHHAHIVVAHGDS